VVDEQLQLAKLRFLLIIHQLHLGMGKHLEIMLGWGALVVVLRCSFRFRHSSSQLRIRLEYLVGYILRFRLKQDCLGILLIQRFMMNLRAMEHIHLIRLFHIHLHIKLLHLLGDSFHFHH
jgi:hypothetical protein